jgi:hypothetical protein
MRAMTRVWILLIVAACASAKETPTSVAGFIPETATSVILWRPIDSPFAMVFGRGTSDGDCLRALLAATTGIYQVFLTPRSSVVVLAGNLVRDKAEACLEEHLGGEGIVEDVHRDGDLTVVSAATGTVYAAWRPPYVILGTRADVTAALTLPPPSAAWRDQVASLAGEDGRATASFSAIGTDPVFGTVLGVQPARWRFVVNPSAAPDSAGGRVELVFASVADAVRANDVIGSGVFAIPLEEHLGSAIAALPRERANTTLTIRFDATSFRDVRSADIRAWLVRAQAQPAAPP